MAAITTEEAKRRKVYIRKNYTNKTLKLIIMVKMFKWLLDKIFSIILYICNTIKYGVR